MTISLKLSREEESMLAAKAEALGVPVDEVVHELIREAAPKPTNMPVAPTSSLPRWPGRILGDLRRENIYDDVE